MTTRPTIGITANLQAELDGNPVDVQASAGIIVVLAKSPKAAKKLFVQLFRFGKNRSWLIQVNRGLLATSQRLEFRLGDTVIASMGTGTKTGLLGIVGLRDLKIWPHRLLFHHASK